MTTGILKQSIIRERDNPKGISYRCHMERPLTDDEVRSHAFLKHDERIDEIPESMAVNVVVTAQSEIEAEEWCRERMPDNWRYLTTNTFTYGHREIP